MKATDNDLVRRAMQTIARRPRPGRRKAAPCPHCGQPQPAQYLLRQHLPVCAENPLVKKRLARQKGR